MLSLFCHLLCDSEHISLPFLTFQLIGNLLSLVLFRQCNSFSGSYLSLLVNHHVLFILRSSPLFVVSLLLLYCTRHFFIPPPCLFMSRWTLCPSTRFLSRFQTNVFYDFSFAVNTRSFRYSIRVQFYLFYICATYILVLQLPYPQYRYKLTFTFLHSFYFVIPYQ